MIALYCSRKAQKLCFDSAFAECILVMTTAYNSSAAQNIYQQELDLGFKRLRFSPALEPDYQKYLQKSHHRAAMICGYTATILWSIFLFYDYLRIRTLPSSIIDDTVTQAWVTCRVSVLIVLLCALNYLRRQKHPPHHLIFITFISCSIGSAFCAAMVSLKGLPSSYHFEAIVIMSAFLPLGLTFYQSMAMALLAVSISLLSFGITNYGRDVELLVRYSIPLFCAIPIGGIGAYLREYAEREQFLYRALFREQATLDPLTGIPNRRLFEQHTNEQMQIAAREHRTVVVALADIDFFKQYNDTHGHDAGDQAIRTTAHKLRSNATRPSDIVARLGGEEFGIFLFDISLSDAQKILQRIVDDVRKAAIQHDGSPLSVLTISIGATQGTHGEIQALLKQADKALYRAKSAGRNQLAINHHTDYDEDSFQIAGLA
jgi:diguanylate cyclase (GGDEF)-like protein